MEAPGKYLFKPLGLILALLFIAQTTFAQGLLFEKAQQPHSHLPAHGLTMADVEGQWGAPLESKLAVGEPPITRWIYSTFTVYFEYDKVIHSVEHPAKTQQEANKKD